MSAKYCVLLLGDADCDKLAFIETNGRVLTEKLFSCTLVESPYGCAIVDTEGFTPLPSVNLKIMSNIADYLLSSGLEVSCVLFFQSSDFLDHNVGLVADLFSFFRSICNKLPNDCCYTVNVSGRKHSIDFIWRYCQDLSIRYVDVGHSKDVVMNTIAESLKVYRLCSSITRCVVLLGLDDSRKSILMKAASLGNIIDYKSNEWCRSYFSEVLDVFIVDTPVFNDISVAENEEILMHIDKFLLERFEICGVLFFNTNHFIDANLNLMNTWREWSKKYARLFRNLFLLVNESGVNYDASGIIHCCEVLDSEYFVLHFRKEFGLFDEDDVQTLVLHIKRGLHLEAIEKDKARLCPLLKFPQAILVPLLVDWITPNDYWALYKAFQKEEGKVLRYLQKSLPKKFQTFFLSTKDVFQAPGLWNALLTEKLVFLDSVKIKTLLIRADVGTHLKDYNYGNCKPFLSFLSRFESIKIDVRFMDSTRFVKRFVNDVMGVCTNIRRLDVSGIMVTMPKVFVENLPSLIELSIECTDSHGLLSIIRARKLHILKLKAPTVNSRYLYMFGFHGPATVIDYTASGGNFTDRSLEVFLWHCASKLQFLSLDRAKLVSDMFLIKLVEPCPGLISLSLSLCDQISDNGLIGFLQSFPAIESLSLTENKNVSVHMINAIAGFPSLKVLRLESLKSPTSLDNIATLHCSNLHTVVLRSCNLTDNVLLSILRSQLKLHSVDISRNSRLTSIALEQAVSYLGDAKDLNISYCNEITDDVAKSISVSCIALVNLDITQCQKVTDVGIKFIVKGCSDLSSLYMEQLCNCSLSIVIQFLIDNNVVIRKLRMTSWMWESYRRKLLEFCPHIDVQIGYEDAALRRGEWNSRDSLSRHRKHDLTFEVSPLPDEIDKDVLKINAVYELPAYQQIVLARQRLCGKGKKLLDDYVNKVIMSDIPEVDKIRDIEDNIWDLTKSYGVRDILFIRYEDMLELGTFPRHPEQKHLARQLSTIDRDNSFMVFVSHSWMRGTPESAGWNGVAHPDNANEDKFKLCVEGIAKLKAVYAPRMQDCYVWFDYGCIEQGEGTYVSGGYGGGYYIKAGLVRFDLIVQSCDCVFTPIVDFDENWSLPASVSNSFVEYRAELWNQGPHAYLNRAWCRVEMMYAANIPIDQNSNGVDRPSMFEEGLAYHVRRNRRPHFLFGTKELRSRANPILLPPLQHSYLLEFHPLDGNVTFAYDKFRIKNLIKDLQPYITANEVTKGYEGETNNNGERHGSGVLTYDDGNVYRGDFLNDMRHGYGIYRFTMGDMYEGNWENDVAFGQGKYTYADGSYYEGEWNNDKKSGTGTYVTVHEGSPLSVYDGEWSDDAQNGHGTLKEHPDTVYEGDFKDGRKNGWGKIRYSDGTEYDGLWKNDKKNGFGIFRRNGSVYEGDWKDNLQHGRGVLRYASGETVVGGWERGRIPDDGRTL